MTQPIHEADTETRAAKANQGVYSLERRPRPSAKFEIKVFGRTQAVAVGDGAFDFEVGDDLDGARLWDAQAYHSVAGAGATVVQIHNETEAVDMLLDPITIDSGERGSRTSASPSDVDPDNSRVSAGDSVRIDVDSAGAGTGLGVRLLFVT